MGLILDLREVEESQGFLEVKHSKYKKGFLTMKSIDQVLSGTIFSFEIGWAETKIMWFEDFGQQPN